MTQDGIKAWVTKHLKAPDYKEDEVIPTEGLIDGIIQFGTAIGMRYYNLGQEKYERLLFLIDMINHGALTQDEHKLLDNILEYAHVKEDDLRRIRNSYTDYNFPTTQDQ